MNIKRNSNNRRFIALLILFFLLSGCGGGSETPSSDENQNVVFLSNDDVSVPSGSISGNYTLNAGMELDSNGATLLIPADSGLAGQTVTLKTFEDFPVSIPLTGSESIVADRHRIEFSAPNAGDVQWQVSVDIPFSENQEYYGLVRMNQSTESAASRWGMVVGEVVDSSFILKFSNVNDSIDLTVVGVDSGESIGKLSRDANTSMQAKSSLSGSTWVVTCRKANVSECGTSQGKEKLSQLARSVIEASDLLSGFGITETGINNIDLSFLERLTGRIRDAEVDYIVIGDGSLSSALHLEWFDTLSNPNALAGVSSAGLFQTSYPAGGNPTTSLVPTYIHELTHGFQILTVGAGLGTLTNKWAIESSAEAIENLLSPYGPNPVRPKRDWSIKLNSENVAYETHVFWRSINGNQSLEQMKAIMAQYENDIGYESVSQILLSTTGTGLADQYVNAVENLEAQSYYSDTETIDLGENPCGKEAFSCTLNDVIGVKNTRAMTANRYAVTFTSCPSGVYNFEFKSDSNDTIFLVNEEKKKNGELVVLDTTNNLLDVEFWVVNKDFEDPSKPSIEVSCACPCEKIFNDIPMTTPPWQSAFSFRGVDRVVMDVSEKQCMLFNPVILTSIFSADPYVYNSLIANSNSCGGGILQSLDELELKAYDSKPEIAAKQYSSCKKIVSKKAIELFGSGMPIAVDFSQGSLGDNAQSATELDCESPTNINLGGVTGTPRSF